MSFWKKLATPVTAPVKAVRQTARLLKIRSRASDVLETAEAAEANPALYRDATWWSKLLRQGSALLDVLPVPQEVKRMDWLKSVLANYKTTIGGIAALASAAAVVANDPSKITDPVTLGLIGAGIAGIAGKDANVTGGSKPQTPEAQRRVD